MTIPDTIALVAGVPLVAVIPGLVEIAKRQGLPARYAGLAAILIATVLLGLASLALDQPRTTATIARWLIGGIVYGLAAAGLYSQGVALTGHDPELSPPDR
jgi:hypothetical protein